MQDGVAAYRWLRQQGVPASRIGIFGDSAGGNLTLTTALSLRKSGDALPAALVPVSGVTDFTLTGPTIRSKDYAEGLLTKPHRDYVERSYVAGADPRDPLLSPLYADPTGLPPTLLMVGSQEVMLSDMTRMADRMRAAKVPVTLEVWRGMPHSWNSAAKPTMETRMATRHLADFLTRHFG
jgi:acetyl esterase/lipase